MFRKANILTLLMVFVISCVVAFAQNTPKPQKEREVTVVVDGGETLATDPNARIERNVQILTDDGGSYLGVQLQEVTKENFSKFGLSGVRGVAVGKVLENSPAKQAGLQDGDVIVRFNGEEVGSVRKLMRLISEVAPDHQAKITVLRGGSEKEFNVTLGKRESSEVSLAGVPIEEFMTPPMPPVRMMRIPRMPRGEVIEVPIEPSISGFRVSPMIALDDGFVWSFGSGKKIGINSIPLTKQLGDYFGVSNGKGILVSNVRENSPAAKVGLKAGDVIIEADGKPLSDQMGLVKALNAEGKKSVTLTIVRDKKRQTITVEPEADITNQKILEKVIKTDN